MTSSGGVMICWYCYWGWAEPVAKIYKEALKKLDGADRVLDHGPAHLVWDDENFDFDSIRWCLDNRFNQEDWNDPVFGFTPEELSIVKWSLEELLKLPEDQVDIWPDDYEGVDPEDFPPPDGVKVEVI